MSELVSTAFGDFDCLALLYRRTRELLEQVIATGDASWSRHPVDVSRRSTWRG